MTMENIIIFIKLIALGVIVMAGVRIAEWLIPAPEMKIVICLASDIGEVEICNSLADLRKKHGG